MQIKEVIKITSCLPPPEYTYFAIREFTKLSPVNDNNDIITYIRIPNFGIADFKELNKIKSIILSNKISTRSCKFS